MEENERKGMWICIVGEKQKSYVRIALKFRGVYFVVACNELCIVGTAL